LKKILLFGAGKSATVLIDYLLKEALENEWKIIIADSNKTLIEEKVANNKLAEAVELDINDASKRQILIEQADIVISMMPPALHIFIAKDCIEFSKHLLTASYADEEINKLHSGAVVKNILFLCEMGLDPGIDHMSAMQLIDEIKEKGGVVTSFKSHCGGLVAPESDNNPWRYKISWNPRNIVLAGQAGAMYKIDNEIVNEKYQELFDSKRMVDIGSDEVKMLSYYPNRNSIPYIDLYGLNQANTFIRTTLRYPDFMYGWKNIVDLKLTDENQEYETDGKTLQAVFKEHMEKNNFGEWLNQKLLESFAETKVLMENVMKLMEAEEEAEEQGKEIPENFLIVDEAGDLKDIQIDEIKNNAASVIAGQMHEANLTLKQLFYLGMDDNNTVVNKGRCSAAVILQFALEKKLMLAPGDKDMVVMLHEIEYTLEAQRFSVKSSLIVKGDDNIHTAMAKTVGLPLGIAAKLILNETIKLSGVHIPTSKEIYVPVLAELQKHDIGFKEVWAEL